MSDTPHEQESATSIKVETSDEDESSLRSVLKEAGAIAKISSAVFVAVSSYVAMKVTDS